MELRFADCSIDCDQYTFSRADERIDLQPKVWAFLRLLAENFNRVVPKNEILDHLWPEVVVSEASLQRLASIAREALGDAELLRTIRGVGYQIAVDVKIIDHPFEGKERKATDTSPEKLPGAAEVRFCRTVDGTNVAWSSAGTGFPVVRALGWFTNLEYEDAWPQARRFWEALGENRRLVRYDGRGMGLSDPAEEFSSESRLRDLEAVVDAAEVERFDLLGLSEGCGTAIRFALRQPERVRTLILYGPPAFLFREAEEADKALGKVMLSLVDAGWGSGDSPFGRMLAELFVGRSASAETRELFDRMQRASTDKKTAIAYFRSMSKGPRPEIASLSTPTVLLHRHDDAIAPFSASRAAAKAIPRARLVPLGGDNHWPMADDPNSAVLLQALQKFLSEQETA